MDKELALLLSEMLIKQDETTSQIQETNKTLRDFMGVTTEFMGTSVKQWEEQHKFNQILIGEIREIKDAVKTFVKLEERVKAVEEREDKFEARLTNVENILKAS